MLSLFVSIALRKLFMYVHIHICMYVGVYYKYETVSFSTKVVFKFLASEINFKLGQKTV